MLEVLHSARSLTAGFFMCAGTMASSASQELAVDGRELPRDLARECYNFLCLREISALYLVSHGLRDAAVGHLKERKFLHCDLRSLPLCIKPKKAEKKRTPMPVNENSNRLLAGLLLAERFCHKLETLSLVFRDTSLHESVSSWVLRMLTQNRVTLRIVQLPGFDWQSEHLTALASCSHLESLTLPQVEMDDGLAADYGFVPGLVPDNDDDDDAVTMPPILALQPEVAMLHAHAPVAAQDDADDFPPLVDVGSAPAAAPAPATGAALVDNYEDEMPALLGDHDVPGLQSSDEDPFLRDPPVNILKLFTAEALPKLRHLKIELETRACCKWVLSQGTCQRSWLV